MSWEKESWYLDLFLLTFRQTGTMTSSPFAVTRSYDTLPQTVIVSTYLRCWVWHWGNFTWADPVLSVLRVHACRLNFHLIQIFTVLRLQPVLSGFWNLKAGATGLYVVLCDPWCMEVRSFSKPLPLAWPVESHRQCGDDCTGNCLHTSSFIILFSLYWMIIVAHYQGVTYT